MAHRLIIAGVAVLVAGAAHAQDYTLPPTFGEASLQAGFVPDPQSIEMTAGGPINAAQAIGGGCNGYIADAPDFRLFYSAGSTYDLTLFARSTADTTLVVNAPDGSWHCNDDADGFDPAVGFDGPLSGQYDIWVGTYQAGQYPLAVLGATELIDVAGGSAAAPAEPMPQQSETEAPAAPADAPTDAPADDTQDQPSADQSGDQDAPSVGGDTGGGK